DWGMSIQAQHRAGKRPGPEASVLGAAPPCHLGAMAGASCPYPGVVDGAPRHHYHRLKPI
ncbi:hypothetical protein HAX54_022910, partial [Datura stramonium]|nr:hypothetical protein [Datura stramonium]